MRRTCLAVVAVLASFASVLVAQEVRVSPVLPWRGEAGAGFEPFVAVSVDVGDLDRFRAGEVMLTGFPVPGGSADLRLEAFDVLAPGAEVVAVTAQGVTPMPRPEVVTLRGTVEGDASSRVFLSLSPWGSHALIETEGRRFALVPPPTGVPGPHLVYDLADLPDHMQPDWMCHVDAAKHDPFGLAMANAGDRDGAERNGPCRVVRVAVDSDYEYTAGLFGGNADASAAYALTLMAAVSEIYTYELNVRLVVPYLRVFTQDEDPYGGSDRLGELLSHWRATKGSVQRDLVHLFSGNYAGGVAYVSVMCSKDWGYAVSGLAGWFPYPLQDHHSGNWDLMVVAHELGHNFGTLHTHDGYDPPIDNCGNGDCSQAWGGTIMSYCHTCPGGMTNIVLRFGPLVIDRILYYLQFQAPCTLTNRLFAVDDAATAMRDAPTRVDVLANDIPLNCDGIVLWSVQGISDAGGSVSISRGTGKGGRDEALYVPPQGFTGPDRFECYLYREGAGYDLGEVFVEVIEPRPADQPGVTVPGVSVAYYAIPPSGSMPDYSTMEPYKHDVVPSVDYPSTNGQFATSGRSSFVGAVFEGYFKAPETGVYVLSVESDDGSMLYLGDALLVNNDGQHGMQERSAPAALEAGLHRLRVEFFENSGSAGLIVRAEGPGLPRQPIPASRWRHADCVADWTRDGVVNSNDFIGFLAEWSAQSPRADLNDDGIVSTFDFLAYLNAYTSGCP
mgnify:CR=1 FL=1